MKPELEIYCHVSEALVSAELEGGLLDAANAALMEILSLPAGPAHVLSTLHLIEISLVDDTTISGIHGQFLQDDSVTDVITFPSSGDHTGEIIVSAETALGKAREIGEPWQRELFRYIVHGLLHLHGYLDASVEERKAMFALQEPVVERCWRASSGLK